jgi:hypothetical protein
MELLLTIHGLFRWVVVILGIVTLVKLIMGVVQKPPFTKLDRQLTLFFGISMDIQILLGILTLVMLGFTRERMEHAFIMLLALVAVHLPARWRNAPDAVRFRNTLISFAISLVLVVIGVALVGGWA